MSTRPVFHQKEPLFKITMLKFDTKEVRINESFAKELLEGRVETADPRAQEAYRCERTESFKGLEEALKEATTLLLQNHHVQCRPQGNGVLYDPNYRRTRDQIKAIFARAMPFKSVERCVRDRFEKEFQESSKQLKANIAEAMVENRWIALNDSGVIHQLTRHWLKGKDPSTYLLKNYSQIVETLRKKPSDYTEKEFSLIQMFSNQQVAKFLNSVDLAQIAKELISNGYTRDKDLKLLEDIKTRFSTHPDKDTIEICIENMHKIWRPNLKLEAFQCIQCSKFTTRAVVQSLYRKGLNDEIQEKLNFDLGSDLRSEKAKASVKGALEESTRFIPSEPVHQQRLMTELQALSPENRVLALILLDASHDNSDILSCPSIQTALSPFMEEYREYFEIMTGAHPANDEEETQTVMTPEEIEAYLEGDAHFNSSLIKANTEAIYETATLSLKNSVTSLLEDSKSNKERLFDSAFLERRKKIKGVIAKFQLAAKLADITPTDYYRKHLDEAHLNFQLRTAQIKLKNGWLEVSEGPVYDFIMQHLKGKNPFLYWHKSYSKLKTVVELFLKSPATLNPTQKEELSLLSNPAITAFLETIDPQKIIDEHSGNGFLHSRDREILELLKVAFSNFLKPSFFYTLKEKIQDKLSISGKISAFLLIKDSDNASQAMIDEVYELIKDRFPSQDSVKVYEIGTASVELDQLLIELNKLPIEDRTLALALSPLSILLDDSNFTNKLHPTN